jgi:hypothetical protein
MLKDIYIPSLKRSLTRDFSTSGFFRESFSPGRMSIPFGPFRIFAKIPAEIFEIKGQDVFHIFLDAVGMLLLFILIYIFFFTKCSL